MRTTLEVWKHHCDAFEKSDIEAVISDFSNNAVYVTTNASYVGKDNIKKLYQNHFDNLEVGSVSKIISERIEGEIVLFQWTVDSPTIQINDGVDTFVIRDGLIVAQTVRATVINK